MEGCLVGSPLVSYVLEIENSFKLLKTIFYKKEFRKNMEANEKLFIGVDEVLNILSNSNLNEMLKKSDKNFHYSKENEKLDKQINTIIGKSDNFLSDGEINNQLRLISKQIEISVVSIISNLKEFLLNDDIELEENNKKQINSNKNDASKNIKFESKLNITL